MLHILIIQKGIYIIVSVVLIRIWTGLLAGGGSSPLPAAEGPPAPQLPGPVRRRSAAGKALILPQI
jgi:hypothetical protein